MDNAKQFLDVVSKLYDAVTDIDKWPAFLAASAELFEAQGAQVAHHDLKNQRLSFSMVHGYDWSIEHYQRYDSLIGEDPRIPHFNNNPFLPMHCRTFLDEETLHNSRVYQEVLSKGDVEYTLGVNLLDQDQAITYFLALRNKDQPPFGEAECALLGELMPHLNRAIKLQKELGRIDFERQVSIDALDSMALGIMVVDPTSTLHFINETARTITDTNDGISIKGNRLVVSGIDERNFYRKLKEQLDIPPSTDQSGEAFQIARASGKEAYSVLVSSYRSGKIHGISTNADSPYAVILIRDLDHPQESRTEILQRIYGLTLSQARLTNLLANGRSLKEAAADLNLTFESARQYLKLVFQKTGTNRQAELVRKVILTPKARNWGDIGV